MHGDRFAHVRRRGSRDRERARAAAADAETREQQDFRAGFRCEDVAQPDRGFAVTEPHVPEASAGERVALAGDRFDRVAPEFFVERSRPSSPAAGDGQRPEGAVAGARVFRTRGGADGRFGGRAPGRGRRACGFRPRPSRSPTRIRTRAPERYRTGAPRARRAATDARREMGCMSRPLSARACGLCRRQVSWLTGRPSRTFPDRRWRFRWLRSPMARAAGGIPGHSGGTAPESHRLPLTTDLLTRADATRRRTGRRRGPRASGGPARRARSRRPAACGRGRGRPSAPPSAPRRRGRRPGTSS